MCGIAGILSLGPRLGEPDAALAGQMANMLRHRGPDSQHVVARERAVLAGARLEIIDLSANADLPMSNEDGTVWITYNGEVTNFRRLRKDFRLDERHHFRSTSDTEVLVHLYEELGIDFVRHLTGYFALCIYDQNALKAWVVRDFFGVRPVFYTIHDRKLHFASEIKALLEIPQLDRTLDVEAFYHFFTLAYIPVPQTPFRAIRELDGGHLVEVDLRTGDWQEREHYRIDFSPDPTDDEANAACDLRGVLDDCIERNLIADVPIGLTLSGGVDSSSLLMLARAAGRRLHTFSIEIAEPSYNEEKYQRIVVEHAKPIHHRVVVTPDRVIDHLVEHMAFMDEPNGDGAAIPMFLLAREAKKHVRVLLSGEGGDEVFNAYETQRACKMRRQYRRYVPAPLRWAIRNTAAALPVSHSKLSFDFVSKRFTQGAELGTPESHIFWRHCLVDADKRALFPAAPTFPETGELFRALYDALPFEDVHDRISWLDLKQYFIGDLMVKNDRMIMASSIEARFPYIDRFVVERSHKIPAALKLNGMNERRVQKLAMKDLLPEAIFRRKNMGLEMPHSGWFFNDFRHLADAYFERERIGRMGFLDPDKVQSLWQEHLDRKRDHGRALWCLISLVNWFELFAASSDYKQYLPG